MGLKIKSRVLSLLHEIPVEKTRTFWEGLNKGDVMATKCNNCRALYYPPQIDCSQCLESNNMSWLKLDASCVLFTYTECHLMPQGFEHYKEPYIICVAETKQGLKVAGWMFNMKLDLLRPGLNVEMSTVIQPDGFPLIRFRQSGN